jgi:hypothetical protein
LFFVFPPLFFCFPLCFPPPSTPSSSKTIQQGRSPPKIRTVHR